MCVCMRNKLSPSIFAFFVSFPKLTHSLIIHSDTHSHTHTQIHKMLLGELRRNELQTKVEHHSSYLYERHNPNPNPNSNPWTKRGQQENLNCLSCHFIYQFNFQSIASNNWLLCKPTYTHTHIHPCTCHGCPAGARSALPIRYPTLQPRYTVFACQ